MANLAGKRLIISAPLPEGETMSMSEDGNDVNGPVTTDVDDNEDMVAPAAANDAGRAHETGSADEAAPETRPEELRLLEALLFAASEPVDEKALGDRLPEGVDVHATLRRLQIEYAPRGVNLVHVGRKWTFRTANDLSWLLTREAVAPKKLSRAAIETLSIIAYHQPVTRAEIEEIRGVAAAKGTLDVLLETGWIRPRGRRKAPGRPLTYGTTDTFLSHFGLEALADLPGLDELKGSGLLDGRIPAGFTVPMPSDDPSLRDDEEPLEPGDLDLGLMPRVEEETDEEASLEAPHKDASEQEAPEQDAPEEETPEEEASDQAATVQATPEEAAPEEAPPEQDAPNQEALEEAAPDQEVPAQEAPDQEESRLEELGQAEEKPDEPREQ